MHDITFSPLAWQQYLQWQLDDKKIARRINELIKDILRNGPMHGIGKPEPLKGRKAFSRRITGEHRLVYTFEADQHIKIVACKGHYED